MFSCQNKLDRMEKETIFESPSLSLSKVMEEVKDNLVAFIEQEPSLEFLT